MEEHTSRAAVIAAEQQAVDYAYKHYDRQIRESQDPRAAAAAGVSPKDGPRIRMDLETRRDSFELNDKSLVTMRVDVEYDSQIETFYIGRVAVRDDNYELVVISWSSRKAIEWRLSTADDPGDVRLLRQIDCNGRKVDGYLDLHGFESPGSHADPRSGNAVRPPSEKELIEPVIKELEGPRSGRMRDAVATIQREQLRLVAKPPHEGLVVQGGPGSGKTVVGVHRAAWLLDNKEIEPKDLLILGPSRRFLNYIEMALEDLGIASVSLSDFKSFWGDSEASADPMPVAAVKGSLSMAEVLHRALENRIDQWRKRLDKFIEGGRFTFGFEGRTVSVPVQDIRNIMAEELRVDRPYRLRRQRCRHRLIELAVKAYTSAMAFVSRDYYKQIEALDTVKRLMDALCPVITAREVLGEILTDREALHRAATGVMDLELQQRLLEHGTADRPSQEDLVCLDELQWLINQDDSGKYKHIIIDEAQDLTPMQAQYLRRRCSGSMTVLGDIAQATGPVHYDSWDDIADILSDERGFTVEELVTSFRTPKEILDFTGALREACAPAIRTPVAVRETDNAVYVNHTTRPAELAAEKAVSLAADYTGDPARSVAVIIPGTGVWHEQIESELQRAVSADRGDEVLTAQIAVLTPLESKGLEFDHVVLLEPAAIDDGTPAGQRALHIAASRSTQSLTIVHWAPLPASFGGPPNAMATPPGVPVSVAGPKPSGSRPAQSCTRYHADGRKCRNRTDAPDGWCRQEPCDGFRSAEIRTCQPKTLSSSYKEGLPRRWSGDHALHPFTRVSNGAKRSFIKHHGGTESEAFSEMQWMVRVFKEHATHHRNENGDWHLDLDGYRLTLKPDGGVISGYATAHAEVSFAQHVAGVPDRAGASERAKLRSALTPSPRNGMGGHEPVSTPEQFARAMPAADLHLTAEACAAFERLDRNGLAYFGQDFRSSLVAKLNSDAATAPVWNYSESEIEIYGEHLTWRIDVSRRSLVNIERTESVA